jgi:hypothetical protein
MLPFDSGFTRSEGEGGTSCHLPFPGRPGLSQSCSRRVFHPAALRLGRVLFAKALMSASDPFFVSSSNMLITFL